MARKLELRLGRAGDAHEIGAMSRVLIERGLGWSWTPSRVARHIRDADSVVLVAETAGRLAGFAIMRFGTEHAHLDLLAVRPEHRRRGIGNQLLGWLEESALVAGISLIYLEVRASNHAAQAFYRKLGFERFRRVAGYYCGRETAVCMARDLWSTVDRTRS